MESELLTFIVIYLLSAFAVVFIMVAYADKILNYIDRKVNEKHSKDNSQIN